MTDEKALLVWEGGNVLCLLYSSINVLFIAYLPCQTCQWVLAVMEFGWMKEGEAIISAPLDLW